MSFLTPSFEVPSEPLLPSLLVPLSSRHLDITAVLGDKVLTLCDVSWCHTRLVANSKAERRCSLLRHVKKQYPQRPQAIAHCCYSTSRASSLDPDVSMGLSFFICKGDTRRILESYSTETQGFSMGLFSHLQQIFSFTRTLEGL